MRCGCGCACVVQSGSDNVEVTGIGTPTQPYEISVTSEAFSIPSVHTFHLRGPLVAVVSDDHPAMVNGTAYKAQARLTTVGSTDTEIEVLMNGAAMGTITVPAGQHLGAIVLAVPVSHDDGDYFNASTVTLGTDAAGLWVGVYVAVAA
jgi:hypothetical protein